MEVTSILAQLARHRRLALLGLLPALLVGLVIAFQVSTQGVSSRSGEVTPASARILLRAQDLPPEDLDPRASESIAARVELIGDLMATQPVHEEIARLAGLQPEQLTVLTPASGTVEHTVPIAIEAVAAATAKTPYVLMVSADGTIPILTFRVGAPSGAEAIKLVRAARGGLAALVSSGPAPGLGLTLLTLGTPTINVVRESSKLPFGVVAALVTFGLWCAAVVVGTGFWQAREHRAPADRLVSGPSTVSRSAGSENVADR